MMNKDHYPKAIAVYEAVLRLIHEEKNIADLTVAGIAKEAGIGKGTTYDYFSSKEEIIAKSLIYGYKMLMEQMVEAISQKKTLKDKVETLYLIAEEYKQMNALFQMILKSVYSSKKLQSQITSAFHEEAVNNVYLEKVIDELKRCAYAESIIGEDYDKNYVNYVMFSVIQLAFGSIKCVPDSIGGVSADQQVQYLYRMILTALHTA